jgi:hypothetical protein
MRVAMTGPTGTRCWYRIAIAVPGDRIELVAAPGDHLGAAIALAERHVPGAVAVAAEIAASEWVPLGESVGKSAAMRLGTDLGDREVIPELRWPRGVIPQLGSTELLRGARRGYVVHASPERLVIEAQTDAVQLTDLFLGLIERLPAGDNLEVRLLDHFSGGAHTDVWLTSRVTSKKVLRFLDDYDIELLENGHVELGVYVRAQRATLRLTEHKTVVWVSEGRALEHEILRGLHALGLPAEPTLIRVAAAPHFHYRPAKSRDRSALAELLFRHRLRRVATVDASGREARSRDTAG